MTTAAQYYDEAEKLKADGNLEEAVATLQKALETDSSYALAHSGLAVALQKLGRHEEAVEHAKKVCDLEPNDPFSYTALSVTFQRAFAGTEEHRYIQLAEEAMERSRQLESQRG